MLFLDYEYLQQEASVAVVDERELDVAVGVVAVVKSWRRTG